MRTNIYIDGFNLYYGSLKGDRSLRWLDLDALARRILKSENHIEHIHYFTAPVHDDRDPDGAQRQQVYLRALQQHIPHLTVHLGEFKVTYPRMRERGTLRSVEVIKTEEKGSDVNLAVHLLNDAWRDCYDCGVVISNDSDLAESLNLVKRDVPGKVLGVIAPISGRRRANQKLIQSADFVKRVRQSNVRQSQLPDTIPGTRIQRPTAWAR